MLQEQFNTVIFADSTHIKYLPPKKTYNMLGVHINHMLDFREHLNHITKDFKRLAKTLAKRILSPSLQSLEVD